MTGIEAETVEAAKEIYADERHYDFDDCEDYDGSWYEIFDADGLSVEDCNLDNRPN
jgi:hypothetical protein